MGLERKLAEIEVLAKSMTKNVKDSSRNKDFDNYLKGVVAEAQTAYDNYVKTLKAIKKKDTSRGSTYIGEFALSLKNVADNLNRFLQCVYSNESNPNLYKLKANTQNAPSDDSGRTLSDIMSVHNHDKNSSLKIVRDKRGHGNSHGILCLSDTDTEKTRRKHSYVLKLEDRTADAKSWIDMHAQNYFGMVSDCLKLIYDKDTEHFESKKKKGSVTLQRLRNYTNRHKRTAIITGSAALITLGLVGGSIGTLAWQNYTERKEAQSDLRKANYILFERETVKNFDSYELGLSRELKEELMLKHAKYLLQYVGPDTTDRLYNRYNLKHPIFVKAYDELYGQNKLKDK